MREPRKSAVSAESAPTKLFRSRADRNLLVRRAWVVSRLRKGRLLPCCFVIARVENCQCDKPGSCLGCRPSAPTLLFRSRVGQNLLVRQAWVVSRLPPVGSYYATAQSCEPKYATETGLGRVSGCRPSSPTILFRSRVGQNLQQRQAWFVPPTLLFRSRAS